MRVDQTRVSVRQTPVLRPRRGLLAAAGLGATLALGLWCAAALADRNPETQPSTPDSVNAPADGIADPGDPRIAWHPLETSMVSPLVADGSSVVFALAERMTDAGPFEGSVYRYTPATGEQQRLVSFLGVPYAAASVGDIVAFGIGNRVLLLSDDGSTRTITLPAIPIAGSAAISPVSALETASGYLYAQLQDLAEVYEIDPARQEVVRTLERPASVPSRDVPGGVTSPDGTVWTAGDAGLLVSRAPDGSVEEFRLPRFRVVPSLFRREEPWTDAELAGWNAVPATVDHMVTLADGTLVLTSKSPRAAIGVIAPSR